MTSLASKIRNSYMTTINTNDSDNQICHPCLVAVICVPNDKKHN